MSQPIPLKAQREIMLFPSAPFHFEGTVHKPSHFPSSDNLYDKGRYWQTMRFSGIVYGTRLDDCGSVDNPSVKLTIYSDCGIPERTARELATEVEYRLDMLADLTDFYTECSKDDLVAPVLIRWRGMRISATISLYEYLVVSTVLQNCTVRRSVQMLEASFDRFGSKVHYDGITLSAFWEPRDITALTEEELRRLKLGYRATTLKRQADALASDEMQEKRLRGMVHSDLRAKLLGIYGVGPASVSALLFDVFKCYGAFDHVPPWEQKIYSRLLYNEELADAKIILEEVSRRWGKWRMLAAHYLFEDLFWQRKNQHIPWLESLIRL